MLTTVVLYGFLGEKYGKYFELQAKTVKQAVSLLSGNFPSFKNDLALHKPGFKVIVDKDPQNSEQLDYPCAGKVIRIIPAVVGAGEWVPIIVGIALIATGPAGWGALAGTFGTGAFAAGLATAGWGLVLAGISTILFAPDPPRIDNTTTTEPNSFSFNGAVNTTRQGGPVPVLYGRMIVGSQVISAGLRTQQINPLTGEKVPISENVITYGSWNIFDIEDSYSITNNYVLTKIAAGVESARVTLPKTGGKWYFELQVSHGGSPDNIIGLSDNSMTLQQIPGSVANSVRIGHTTITAGASFATPQGTSLAGLGYNAGGTFTVNIAIDLTEKRLWLGKDNVWSFSGSPVAGTNPTLTWGITTPILISQYLANTGSACTIRTGKTPMQYAAPPGFNTGWYD